jgi:hypothetical protein
MKKVIVITMHNRPAYSRAILKGLSECVGIDEYHIIICVEPVSPEVLSIAKRVKFAECEVVLNKTKLGCSGNSFEALKRGFDVSDFVIYVQDDDLLAPDALRYYEWASEKFRDDPTIYTVGSWNLMKEPCPESHYYRVMKRQHFTSLTLATWKDRWAEPGGMLEDWDFDYRYEGWDVNITKRLRKDRWEVFPWMSRSQNIGEEGGTHCPSTEWHRRTIRNEFWAGDPRVVDMTRQNANRMKDLVVLEF